MTVESKRVYELAKEYDMANKDFIEYLETKLDIKVKYKQMSPDSSEFTIKGLDPEQHLLEIRIYSDGFFKEAAADFMNNITMISKFPDRDIATAYYKIKNYNREMTDVVPLLQKMKWFYSSNYESNTDELFWDRIRKSIDNTIEAYKKLIDTLKL